MTDLAKESLFERLHGRIEQGRIADVFAGTGTLGLEALSRGARCVVFIESDRRAYELLKENVAMLGVEREALCWRADVLRCSFRPKGTEGLFPYDLVFVDPPYRMIPELKAHSPLYKSLERLARDDVTAAECCLVLRTPKHSEFEMPAAWQIERTLDIAKMEIHLFCKQGPTS